MANIERRQTGGIKSVNRLQWITLALALFNLLLVGLFPPFDYLSQARAGVATFDGFA
jgi:hypothetical protein